MTKPSMTKFSVSNISEYVERIYAAVLQPQDMVCIMQSLRLELDAPLASLQLENTQNHELGLAHLINYDTSAIEQYAEHFIHCDPWTNSMIANDAMNNPFKVGQKMVADKHYRESEFYRDWGRHVGVRHAIGSGFNTCAHQVLKIAFQRHCDHRAFAQAEEDFLNVLYPHFVQWVRLSNLFEQHQQRNSILALDYLDRPVWLLNQQMQVIYNNRQVQSWLNTSSLLHISQGCLQALHYEQQQKLEQKVQRLCQPEHASCAQTVQLANSHQCHVFWVLPLHLNGRRFAMLVGPKPQQHIAEIEQRFSLTQRQAQVACGLVKGQNVAQIASELNISLNTVKNQLASCFARLQVQNQSHLVEVIQQGCRFS